MDKRIVYTRFDGGVSVCCPTDECIAWMTGGGGIWDKEPPGFLEVQIERMIEAGHGADASRRFARAVQFGGCTTAEALGIIRDRDCAHLGTAIELWDAGEIPADRWFRNAWRRSHNGGPICIDLNLAKPIQFQRIKAAIDKENARRSADLYARPIEIDAAALRTQIIAADDESKLRRIWPKELARA